MYGFANNAPTPSGTPHAPTWGTSRRLGPPSPGASRPHSWGLTPGQAVPTWGLTREAPGVPQGGPPWGYRVTHIMMTGEPRFLRCASERDA